MTHVALFIFFANAAFAQSSEERAFVGLNNINLGFRQEFNTYLWTAGVSLDQQISSRWHVAFQESFRTSMLRLSSQGDRWKDDQDLGLRLSYSMLSNLVLQSQLQSVIFLDKQSGFNNDARSHFGTVGLIYRPVPQIYAAANVGPKWDSRFYQDDQGVSYDVRLRGDRFDLAGYDNNVDFTVAEDRYDRRTNSNLMASYRVNKQFTPSAADSLDIYLSNQRRDNYVSIAGDIESQREDVKGLRNTLYYNINKFIDMNLKTFLEFKNVELLQYGETSDDRRRKRNDQRFTNDLSFILKRDKMRGRFDLLYAIQQQRYDISVNGRPFSQRTAFITPDNSSSRLMATARLESRLARRDSTALYFSISKFQYDTPDTTNFDDRDELRINTNATWMHWFSSSLQLELLARVNLYHMVYIFGERSADNNWNRIFVLRPGLNFRPSPSFKLHQSFEVLANYVDYDFEDPNVQTRSFVFRKFAMTDSLQWRIMPRTRLAFNYRLQLEENGQLYWEQWSQNLVANRVKQWFHVSWQYQLQGQIYLTPGYSIYKRDEWRFSNQVPTRPQEKEKVSTYISHGPVLKIHVTPRPNLRLFVDATRYKVTVTDQNDYFVNNIDIGLHWIF